MRPSPPSLAITHFLKTHIITVRREVINTSHGEKIMTTELPPSNIRVTLFIKIFICISLTEIKALEKIWGKARQEISLKKQQVTQRAGQKMNFITLLSYIYIYIHTYIHTHTHTSLQNLQAINKEHYSWKVVWEINWNITFTDEWSETRKRV